MCAGRSARQALDWSLEPSYAGVVQRSRFVTLTLALCCVIHSFAWASDPDTLIRSGVQFRAEGKDLEALAAFEQADGLRPAPITKAQIGLAEQALGLWGRAEIHTLQALASESDPWITKNRHTLEGALATIQLHLGDLDLRGGEPGAVVWIDGVSISTLPLKAPLRLELGRRQVSVRFRGFHEAVRIVDIVSGKVARETLLMLPEHIALPRELYPRGADGRSAFSDANERKSPKGIQRPLGFAFLGVGGAAVLFGGVSMLIRESITQSYNSNPRCDTPGAAKECTDQASARGTWTTLALGSFVGGGVSAIVGGLLLLTAPSPSSNSLNPIATALHSCHWDGASLACFGRF
jgi:hypothetical protein